MRIGTCLLHALTGAFVIAYVHTAFGNGRNTPEPRGASPVKAICRQVGNEKLEISRVKLTHGDQLDETLQVVIGGDIERLSIREIKELRFLTNEINADGFRKAEISRADNPGKTSAMVQVRSGATPIRLKGFRSSGTSVSIDLSKCQAVAFSPAKKALTGSSYRLRTAD